MFIKILGASSSFNGVDYSERKTVNGRGELLMTKNFTALELKGGNVSKQDYLDYLIDFSSSNSRIKDSQFHVTISGKGREYSFDQLVNLGEQYLEHMGYSENPYLIYAHSDTPNNHIHIITSRVGQDGKKINDSYEQVRSQNFITKTLSLDPEKHYQNALSDCKKYKFSTDGQFRMLMESKGYLVIPKDESLEFVRGGIKQGSVSIKEIESMFTDKVNYDTKRIAQVKQLFDKYKVGFDTSLKWDGEKRPGQNDSLTNGKFTSDFSEQMKRKFGLELVYHVAKNKNVYSYSIIDQSKNQVYKGSDILDLKQLLGATRGQESSATLLEQVNEALQSKLGFVNLQKNLKDQGIVLNTGGVLRMKGSNMPILHLDVDTLKVLKYQTRVINANIYSIPGIGEAKVLAKLSYVHFGDLAINERFDGKLLREKLNSVFFNHFDLKSGLKGVGVDVIKSNNEYFLIDKKDNIIVNATSILNAKEIEEIRNTEGVVTGLTADDPKRFINNSSNSNGEQPGRNEFYQGPESDLVSLDEISNLIGGIHDETDPAESAAKRRKRSR